MGKRRWNRFLFVWTAAILLAGVRRRAVSWDAVLADIDEMANNPAAAAMSDPDAYLEAGAEAHQALLEGGEETAAILLDELEASGASGLREYLMAAVCAEITGVGCDGGWSTAAEWVALYRASQA